MHRQRLARAAAWVVLVVLAAIFLAPQLNVSRFRHRIERSVSAGLGRPVQVGAVSFRLFPSPAFVLSDVTVAEDPAFGAEPAMSAPTVTAALQMGSLLRGHFAVATLSLEDPSLNLTRGADGRWDFDSILRRSNAAPSNARTQFPYVEATGARINFKYGAEKQPFSLMDGDLALWRESAGQWHLRLKAQPLRTDLDMNDTGELRAEAAIHFAPTAALTPVTAHVEWSPAPLGEMSRLLSGGDSGWRGMAQMSGDASGTLADLGISAQFEVEGLRRTEVVPADALNVNIGCHAQLDLSQSRLQAIDCSAPAGEGSVRLTGNLALGAGLRAASDLSSTAPVFTPTLQVELRQLTADTALQWLRHVRAGIAPQMSAAGEMNGSVACSETAQGFAFAWNCTGAVHLLQGALLLPGLAHPLPLPELDWVCMQPTVAGKKQGRKSAHSRASAAGSNNDAANRTVPIAFTLAPAHLSLGASAPAVVTGTVTARGYSVSLNGPATLETLLPMAQAMGWTEISARVQGLQGRAVLALTRQGVWLASAAATGTQNAPPSRWSGTVQLQNVQATLANWPGQVQLATATAHLDAGSILLDKMRGSYQQQSFDGSLRYAVPQASASPETSCSFHLHSAVWTPGQMHLWKRASTGSSPRWLAVVQRWMGDLPTLPDCTGTLQADRIVLGAVVLNHAALNVHLHGQRADVSNVQGSLWGGTVQGNGSLERGNDQPEAQVQLTVHDMQAASMAAAFHAQHWGSGSIDAQLRGTAQGWSVQQMIASAVGKLSLQCNAGTWNAAALAATPLAKWQRLSLQATMRNQAVEIHQGDLFTAGRHVQVGGAVNFSGAVHLTLQPGSVQVQGTLAHPIVAVAATQSAALPTP